MYLYPAGVREQGGGTADDYCSSIMDILQDTVGESGKHWRSPSPADSCVKHYNGQVKLEPSEHIL